LYNNSVVEKIYGMAYIFTLLSVKQAKDATKPFGKERTLLKQYEILTAGNLEKLIKRKTSDGECYVDTVRLGFISRTCSIVNYHGCTIKDHWEMDLHAKLNQGLLSILYKPERNIGFHWITSYIL
jgi:hypothetical protein